MTSIRSFSKQKRTIYSQHHSPTSVVVEQCDGGVEQYNATLSHAQLNLWISRICKMVRTSVASSVATLAALAASETVRLNVARSAPASSSPPISLDFQSFSIEFAFFVDFNGNYNPIDSSQKYSWFLSGNKSHPNKFTNNLLANLRAFNGDVPQILRI